MNLHPIEEPVIARADHPLWRLGFRPFYLLAASFAALSVPLWVARYLGLFIGWQQVGLGWHMHEMVFGMAIAVIIGFLYTAGRTWTGLDTPRGSQLAALAALWLAGRLAMLAAPEGLAAPIDLLFLPLAGWPLYQVLTRSGNKRNLFLVGLLGLLTLANVLYHASALAWLALAPTVPVQAAILVIVVIESVIGARVIPMFTRNGAPGTEPLVHPRRDQIALALTAGASLGWTFGLAPAAVAALAVAAGCAILVRLVGWQPQRTLGVPLLWSLHLAYAWIPVGFFLLALAALGVVSSSAAFHALTVGSMAGLIIGMMTRTTLGHTGRPLKTGRAEPVMFGLVQAGAVLRLCAALGPLAWRDACLVAAAACWSVAFLIYLAVYAPYLWRARLDGRDG
ncbi:MAG: NnrS family protein [Pseudomonadota bacterium]